MSSKYRESVFKDRDVERPKMAMVPQNSLEMKGIKWSML